MKRWTYSILMMALVAAPLCLHAEQLYDMNSVSVRALGMGNAYTAMVNDADALFYNPAGLAKVGGVNWTVFDIAAGLNGMQSYKNIQNVMKSGSSDLNSTLKDLYGQPIGVVAHAKTAIALPSFALAFYGTSNSSIAVNNPAVPDIDANLIYDYGVALGSGVNVAPGVQVGMVAKRIIRTGTRKDYHVSDFGDLTSISGDTLQSDFKHRGIGYSLDSGLNLVGSGPFKPTLSFVWRNMGGTKFVTTDSSIEIPSDPDEMIVGASAQFDSPLMTITPALDFRYANRTDVDLTKKFNLGVEINLPMLDLRAGLEQGYYTLGAGFSMGLFRVDAATYAIELGEHAGQFEDRFYVVQFTMQLGFDMGLHFTGPGASISRRDSPFGTHYIKQRR